MKVFVGIIGIVLLLDAGGSLDQRIQPGEIIEAAVGGVLLIAALIAWLIGVDD